MAGLKTVGLMQSAGRGAVGMPSAATAIAEPGVVRQSSRAASHELLVCMSGAALLIAQCVLTPRLQVEFQHA